MKQNFAFKHIVIMLLLSILSSCITQNKPHDDMLYRIRVGDKFGFIDCCGSVAIEPQYDYAEYYFSDGVCFVSVGNNKYIIDRTGSILMNVSDSISKVFNFSHNVARIKGKSGIGIMNIKGKLIIPAINYDAQLNIDGDNSYIVVKGWSNNRDWYITDLAGNIIGDKCDSILTGFCQGLCAVKLDNKWGYMNTDGELAISAQFDYAGMFSTDKLADVRKEKEEFYIDTYGDAIIHVEKAISGFKNNRALAEINGKKYLIDKNGNRIKELDCDMFYGFRDNNLCTITKNGLASRIDKLGNVVRETQFAYIGRCINGRSFVKINDKWGLVDENCDEVVRPVWYQHTLYSENSSLYGFWYYVSGQICLSYFDRSGKLIWQDIPPAPQIRYTKHFSKRDDFINYYDTNITNLDPIEGIYYVTRKTYYQDREELNKIGLNSSSSEFYAITKNNDKRHNFIVYMIDRHQGSLWINEFAKLGESNKYAIIPGDTEYESGGSMSLDDPTDFGFRLEMGKNDYYNFFVTYEFLRDYPSAAEVESYHRGEWSGSGFAIADGYIATNYHVVNGAKDIRIKGVHSDPTKAYRGFVIASDKKHDLSIIRVVDPDFTSFGKIPYCLGKKVVDVGDNVFVLGYPMTSSMGTDVKLTTGIISSSTGYKGDDSMYQISAPVQPGNSGGPLFNDEGNVIGVVCGKHTEAENANYAIKVSYIYNLSDEANLNIPFPDVNRLKYKKLSSQVKKVKDYVFLIECSK